MSLCKQDQAELIANALHAVEADPAFKGLPRRMKAKVSRLHRLMHEVACEHGPALGIDVAPLSGGLPKPD